MSAPEQIGKSSKRVITDQKGTLLKCRVIRLLMTRELDYALRILRALHREEKVSASTISQREHISKAITLKLLKRLHASGLVSSCRGAKGGYSLSSSCEEMTVTSSLKADNESEIDALADAIAASIQK